MNNKRKAKAATVVVAMVIALAVTLGIVTLAHARGDSGPDYFYAEHQAKLTVAAGSWYRSANITEGVARRLAWARTKIERGDVAAADRDLESIERLLKRWAEGERKKAAELRDMAEDLLAAEVDK